MRKGTQCFEDFAYYMKERNGIDIEDGWYTEQSNDFVKLLGSVGEVAVHYERAYNDALKSAKGFGRL